MVSHRLRNVLVLPVALVIATACGDDPQEPEGPELPDADGTALWSHLEDQAYEENWALWPGKGEKYEGNEPHGMLLTTYVNEIALDALQDGATTLPEGAIVVKENYMPDSTFVAITTMYKVDGFNPDANDWFWLKNDPEGVIEVEGAVDGCIGCHAGATGHDYLWTLQQQSSSQ